MPYAAAAAAGAGSAEISTMKQKDERRKRDENRQMMVMRMHAVTCGTWPFFVMLMKLLEFSFSRSMLLSVCVYVTPASDASAAVLAASNWRHGMALYSLTTTDWLMSIFSHLASKA